ARAGPLAHPLHLAQERRGKARLVHRLVTDMAVEVAIRTLGRTERPVHVDSKACLVIVRIHLLSRAFANSWKARARCDSACSSPGFQPCFSSELISPKVRS